MTKWGTLLHRVFQDAELSDPVVAKDLGGVEAALGVRLPADLSGCLAETNGASALYGTAILWSAAEIVERNREMRDTEDFRDLYMPFDALLFVGEGETGICSGTASSLGASSGLTSTGGTTKTIAVRGSPGTWRTICVASRTPRSCSPSRSCACG